MEFQLNYLKSCNMMPWKCCTQYASKFGKFSSGHRTGKAQFSFQSLRKAILKKGKAKECSNYRTMLISHASKVMLKILQARLQQYVNWELQGVQAGFRKGRGIKLPTSVRSSKKQESSEIFCFIDYAKAFDYVDHKNCGKFFKRWEYHITLPVFWETCMQVKKQQLELNMENGLVPNWERCISRMYFVTLLI